MPSVPRRSHTTSSRLEHTPKSEHVAAVLPRLQQIWLIHHRQTGRKTCSGRHKKQRSQTVESAKTRLLPPISCSNRVHLHGSACRLKGLRNVLDHSRRCSFLTATHADGSFRRASVATYTRPAPTFPERCVRPSLSPPLPPRRPSLPVPPSVNTLPPPHKPAACRCHFFPSLPPPSFPLFTDAHLLPLIASAHPLPSPTCTLCGHPLRCRHLPCCGPAHPAATAYAGEGWGRA